MTMSSLPNTVPDSTTTPTPTPSSPNRPFILIVTHALTGHLTPLLPIASYLTTEGYPVFFLGPTAHSPRITATGATFLPLTGAADLNDKEYYAAPPTPGYAALPWHERVLVDIREQCLEPLPTQWECVKSALQTLYERDPARDVVVVAEAFFHGILPLFHGAPLPPSLSSRSRPRTLCVSVTVPAVRSVDLPPSGYPFAYDASAAGRARNTALWRGWARRAERAGLSALLEAKMREAGATTSPEGVFLSGANYVCHDRILQIGVPGFEYPRSDWPPGFRFVGLVQGPRAGGGKKPREPDFPWWAADLVPNSALDRASPRRRKVVVVAQGTVEINPHDLIIPTIQALAGREDILVIAILGWKDAKLSEFITVPSNAKVADYLSYDAVLAHADVWVHNAGFGAVNHGIANGVPMVVAGEGMDKTENARRVAWSGVGVDLGCATPTVEQVKEGIERVLRDEQFASRVAELKREDEAIDCFSVIHEELLGLVGT